MSQDPTARLEGWDRDQKAWATVAVGPAADLIVQATTVPERRAMRVVQEDGHTPWLNEFAVALLAAQEANRRKEAERARQAERPVDQDTDQRIKKSEHFTVVVLDDGVRPDQRVVTQHHSLEAARAVARRHRRALVYGVTGCRQVHVPDTWTGEMT